MTSNTKAKTKKSTWFVLFLLALGIIVGMVLSLGMAEVVEQTGDAKFCAKCHTMEPMTKSYHASTHGGANKEGVQAECNDCHLPHDNVAKYLYYKAKIGLHDIRVQTFGDLEAIDWEAKRKHIKDYVFDSGCIKCHENLQNATMATPKGFIAHKAYFEKTSDKKCIECHTDVGHKSLGMYLKKAKMQKKEH